MYRNLIIIASLILSTLIVSCSGDAESATTTDPNAMKLELRKKQRAIQQLKAEIKQLETKIKSYDPEFVIEGSKKKTALVSVQQLEAKTFEKTVELQGVVESKGNFNATAQMSGNITWLNIKEGDRVRKGQIVAKLDSEIMEKNEEELQLALNLAKDVFQRRQKLWEQKIGSEMEFLKAKNDVESLETKLSTLATQTSKYAVYSPVTGVVDVLYSKQGELASPGMPIAKIIDQTNVQVIADVAETYLGTIKEGDKVLLEFPSLGIEREAKISGMGATINPANRTFRIEIAVNNRDKKLLPNLMANIRAKESEIEGAVVVPTNAIMQDLEGDYLYVADEVEGRSLAKKVYVKRGSATAAEVVITEGLTGEELLITEGQRALKSGTELEIVANIQDQTDNQD